MATPTNIRAFDVTSRDECQLTEATLLVPQTSASGPRGHEDYKLGILRLILRTSLRYSRRNRKQFVSTISSRIGNESTNFKQETRKRATKTLSPEPTVNYPTGRTRECPS